MTDNTQNSIDIIRKLFADYLDTSSAILQSHVFTEDAELELKQADKNLLTEIDNLEIITGDFASLIEQLKALIEKNDPEFDPDEVLELIDLTKEDIADKAAEFGFIELSDEVSLMDREKVRDFINTNIYPHNINCRSNA